MGGLIGKNQQNKKEYVKANKIIGREMKCNTCGKIFSAHTNLNLFNNHINNCFQINRERDRIENLLNDLRETNLEIEQLEKIKKKKKEAEIKKTKKEKINKQINTNKNNNLSSNKEILINPSDLIFLNPNMIFNNQFNYNNTNNFVLNTNEDEIEKLNLSDIDTNSLKELPFDEKLEFFRSYVKNFKVDWREGSCTLEIDREDCFRQSMIQFEKIDPFKELKINFRGEVSHDAGGLIREWYSIIFKHILSPGTKLFEKSDSDEYSFRFSRFINPSIETLDIMFFIGKIIAKALLDNLTINTCFNKIIYKMLLNENIILDDLVFIDKPLYNSLKEMKKIENLDNLGIYFNVEYILNGKLVSEDLIPNGSNIHVSKDNLEEYIKKRIEHMQIKEKNFINEMKNGMLQILPEKLIEIFNSDELELFINGYPFIDLDDWKANTVYKGFSPNDELIINFWDIMNRMSQKELSTFLQFCTGSSRVPIGGFETIESNRGNIAKFCITKSTLSPGKNFIRAHTCFNRLDLPEFKNKRDLQEAMNFVAKNEILGFGID